MKEQKRSAVFLLGIMLLVSLVGCSNKKEKEEESHVINYDGKPNVPADSNMIWIDSDIYGAIDASLVVSEKDDFYTAVNKEWLLEQPKPTDDYDDTSLLMEGSDIVKNRLIKIVSGEQDSEAFDGNQVDIADEEILHDQELVVQFVTAAADWEARNAAGVEPLKKYIDDIAAISSLDAFTEYMVDVEGRNISQQSFVEIGTYAGTIDAQTYKCIVSPDTSYVLNEYTAYTNMSFKNHVEMHFTDKIVKDVLLRLGYEEDYTENILRNCYRLEGMLIDHTNEAMASNPDAYKTGYSLDEIKKISGQYPFEEIYHAYGYSLTDDIRIADKAYFKYLNRIYKESNLDLFKAYFIVHTINNNILLLDRNYYDLVIAEREKYTINEQQDEGNGDTREIELKDDWDLILNEYTMPYMGGPLNVVYVSRYCSLEQKKALIEIVDKVIENYHKMIDAEEWMSQSAKASTHEKLDYMTIRVLYPDTMESFMELQFAESDNLLAMVQKIRLFETKKQAKKANQPVDKKLWDLGYNPTTVVNAYYKPNDNSINILAGIISGDNVFKVDSKDEVNLARIGTIIGHEISHAFDSSGCYYDKDGYKKVWWDMDDLTAFQLRVNHLSNYYSGITPFPGARNLTGMRMSGEAIADMGGMKVVLMIAKERQDFDYDLFFRSYAELWRVSRSLGMEAAYVEQDVHPLSYLRTNITLSQFQEFIDTYGIKEGDGMYCAPEDRIKVW